MDTFEKKLVVLAFVLITALTIMTIYADIHKSAYAPNGRRWPVTTGMELPLVNIVDENGYYATLACKVTSFNNQAHQYNLSCGDAPEYVTIRGR